MRRTMMEGARNSSRPSTCSSDHSKAGRARRAEPLSISGSPFVGGDKKSASGEQSHF
jgi:hypothetical protein